MHAKTFSSFHHPGTGYPNILKEVSVPHITNEQCNRPDWRNCVVRGCMMCAGAYKAAPCEGDSGEDIFAHDCSFIRDRFHAGKEDDPCE